MKMAVFLCEKLSQYLHQILFGGLASGHDGENQTTALEKSFFHFT
jgi:hypothetical protein